MKPVPQADDQWAAATAYERFMGRWSRRLAREFVAWLGSGRGRHWLELGCGTGALTAAICAGAEPASVTACDPVERFITHARANPPDARVAFVVAGEADFPMRPGGYDSVTSLLALNFFPDPAAALARARSATAGGGTVSACVWDYAGEMQFLRYFWDGARAISPTARDADEGVRFPVCRPDNLRELCRGVGLAGIRCEPLEIATPFVSFDDYWQPLLGGTGPAPSFVASLDEERRARLRAELQARLPAGPDGTIVLRARAWAVSGLNP